MEQIFQECNYFLTALISFNASLEIKEIIPLSKTDREEQAVMIAVRRLIQKKL